MFEFNMSLSFYRFSVKRFSVFILAFFSPSFYTIASENTLISQCTPQCMREIRLLKKIQSRARAKIEARKRERRTQEFAYYIGGIVETDTIKSKSLSKRRIDYYTYNPSSIDTLQRWLSRPFEKILDPFDPALVNLGKTCTYDMKRITLWCSTFLRHYPLARKTDQPGDEVQSRACLTRALATTQSQEEADKLQKILGNIHQADRSRFICDSMVRNIGSYCALKAAQQARYSYKDFINRGALPSPSQLFQMGGAAQSLYEALIVQEYQARCQFNQIPTVLQHAPKHSIESFLYDPRCVMQRLHSLESTIIQQNPYCDRYDNLIIGDENFALICHENNTIKKTALYGLIVVDALTEDDLVRLLTNSSPQQFFPYTIRSLEGSPNIFLIELGFKNNSHPLFIAIQYLQPTTSSTSIFGTINSNNQHIGHVTNSSVSMLWLIKRACGKTLLTRTPLPYTGIVQDYILPSDQFNTLAIDDTGNKFIGAGTDTGESLSAPLRNLYTGSHSAERHNINWNKESLTHPLTQLAIGLSHAGKICTISGLTESGATMLAITPTKYAHSADDWINIPHAGRIKKLEFSRDDTRLFLHMEEEEKKKTSEKYFMIDLTKKPQERTLIPCTAPRLKEGSAEFVKTTLDQFGEYIGTYARTTTDNLCKVIPTEYHLNHKLVPTFKKFGCSDRLMLYWLHEALRSSPELHISPDQWKDLSQLGIKPHIMVRKGVHLTSSNGTKLRGRQIPSRKTPCEISLSSFDAIHAACQISGQQVV